jgi:hypothetical protein
LGREVKQLRTGRWGEGEGEWLEHRCSPLGSELSEPGTKLEIARTKKGERLVLRVEFVTQISDDVCILLSLFLEVLSELDISLD